MEPNVILKYKRPTDSWICPDCDCENKLTNDNCFVCACARPSSPVIVNAWSEKDEKIVEKKQPATSKKAPAGPTKAPVPKKVPVKPAVSTPPRGYTPIIVEEPPKKSGSKVFVILLTIILIAAIVAVSIFIINNRDKVSSDSSKTTNNSKTDISPSTEDDETKIKYDEAMEEFSNGNYEKAAELFAALPADYEDVADKLNESKYNYALELAEEDDPEKIEEARTIFEELGTYSDSDTQMKMCTYKLAEIYYEDEDYTEARKLFEELGDFDDCEERVKDCIYNEATLLMEKELYLDAKELFDSIPGHNDADNMSDYCYYEYALALYYDENYEEAESIFRELDDYNNSAYYLDKCVYARADEYIDNYNFVDAMKLIYDHTQGDLYDSEFINAQNELKSYNRSNGYFPDTSSIVGNWKTDDGDTLNYITNGSSINMKSSMPWTYSSNYTFEDGVHSQELSYSNEIQWIIQRVSSTSIRVFNYHNGKIYNFTK